MELDAARRITEEVDGDWQRSVEFGDSGTDASILPFSIIYERPLMINTAVFQRAFAKFLES